MYIIHKLDVGGSIDLPNPSFKNISNSGRSSNTFNTSFLSMVKSKFLQQDITYKLLVCM